MNRNENTFLGRVNPEEVVIDPKYLTPSDWDCKAIVDDLREYVRVSRLIKATPVLRIVENELKLVSGEPFMRAALEVEPRLHEVVCLIKVDDPKVLPNTFQIANATDVMVQFSENETYEAVEMLTFSQPVTDHQKKAIEHQIVSFFEQVHANPGAFGGNYVSISAFDWDDLNNRVTWHWERSDQPGSHQLVFLDLLRKINDTVATLRSWNGLAIHLDDGK